MGIFSWREVKSHSDGGLKGPLNQWLTCLLSQGNSLQMFSFTYEQCMVMVFLLPLSRWCGTHAGEVRVCPASVFDLKRLSSTAPFWGCAHLCDRARLSRQVSFYCKWIRRVILKPLFMGFYLLGCFFFYFTKFNIWKHFLWLWRGLLPVWP